MSHDNKASAPLRISHGMRPDACAFELSLAEHHFNASGYISQRLNFMSLQYFRLSIFGE